MNSTKLNMINAYLARGWALVPLHYVADGYCSCGKSSDPTVHRSAGKHPTINQWQHHPARTAEPWSDGKLNIGIATGAPSRFWVLDFDPGAPGIAQETYDIARRLDYAARPPHVQTGGDGRHWRFAMPADFEPTNRRGTLPAGLDVRGTGGQVVAPPSMSGKGLYVQLSDAEPYVAPAWLLEMIRPAEPRGSSADGVPPAGWSPALTGVSPSRNDDRGSRYARAAVGQLLTELGNAHNNRNDLAWRAACRIIELRNAGWLDDGGAAYEDWQAAALLHPAGVAVPYAEVASIWRSASTHVGRRAAELPPDPLDISAGALPALPAWEPPPFVGSGNGAGSQPLLLADPGAPAPVDPWEAAVAHEVSRLLVRREAQRRIDAPVGDPTAIDAEWLDVDGMLALPEPEPLVAGVLCLDSLARINGSSGHGKSFIALDLALRVTCGMAWAGRPVSAVPVDYVVAEGARGFGLRVRAWRARHAPATLAGVRFLPRPVQMLGPEWSPFVESVRRRGARLVVIDTQARATEGIDEVDRAEMSRLVAAAEALRVATGACVLLVHHTPQRGDDGRGHTEVKGALQTELLVRKDGRQVTITCRKQKDSPEFDPITFELIDVVGSATVGGLADPAAVLGVVPVWSGEREVTTVRADERPAETARQARARMLWRVLRDRGNRGDGLTRAEARVAFGDDSLLSSVKSDSGRKYFADAWNDLIQLGLLAQKWGAARFVVVVRSDQSAEGFLTDNAGKDAQAAPDGYDIVIPAEKAD